MSLLSQLNSKIFIKNNNLNIHNIVKQLKIGSMLNITTVNLEKSKIKNDNLTGKVIKLKHNGLLTCVELLIKTSTMSCSRKIYLYSPLITKIEII